MCDFTAYMEATRGKKNLRKALSDANYKPDKGYENQRTNSKGEEHGSIEIDGKRDEITIGNNRDNSVDTYARNSSNEPPTGNIYLNKQTGETSSTNMNKRSLAHEHSHIHVDNDNVTAGYPTWKERKRASNDPDLIDRQIKDSSNPLKSRQEYNSAKKRVKRGKDVSPIERATVARGEFANKVSNIMNSKEARDATKHSNIREAEADVGSRDILGHDKTISALNATKRMLNSKVRNESIAKHLKNSNKFGYTDIVELNRDLKDATGSRKKDLKIAKRQLIDAKREIKDMKDRIYIPDKFIPHTANDINRRIKALELTKNDDTKTFTQYYHKNEG